MSQTPVVNNMLEAKPYVRIDEHGVYRVGNTRVMLDSVVAGFQDGDSCETIRQNYPSLSLEEVYGSIAYYLGHREEVDAYLKRQRELWEKLRKQSEENPSPVLLRLRAIKAQIAKAGISQAQWLAERDCQAHFVVGAVQPAGEGN